LNFRSGSEDAAKSKETWQRVTGKKAK